jgi:futalosine hydrolase
MIKTGNFITVSAVSGSQKRAKDLGKRFGAVCENMEGAAIAQVCALYELPMIELRGISNMAGVRDKRKWNLKIASENCQKLVLETIKKL